LLSADEFHPLAADMVVARAYQHRLEREQLKQTTLSDRMTLATKLGSSMT
jgi:hypothetical protein